MPINCCMMSSLPRAFMVTKPKDSDILQEIFRQRTLYSSPLLSVKVKKTNGGKSRGFFIVPSSVAKGAVARNRLKRRARGIFQSALGRKSELVAVVFFKKGSEKLTFAALREEMSKFLTKLI